MKKQFVFLAHWVESWNWLLWWSHDLHRNPQHAWRWVLLAPIYKIVSFFYLFGKKGHNVVDQYFFGDHLEGKTYLLRNFGWHFFVGSVRRKIKQRILDTVLVAQESGAEVIGLGALVKAEWLTKGGRWVVDTLGEKLHVPVVHGDTLTAAAVYHQTLKVIGRMGFEVPLARIFITGATSKIGRAVVLKLAELGCKIYMYTKSDERFEQIQGEAGLFGCNLIQAKSMRDGKDCQIWLTGKAVPKGKKLLRAIPKGAAVLNFSVPNPLVSGARKDLVMEEAGLLAYDPSDTTLSFTMRLRPGLTYACHAGTMVHAAKEWKHHEVDQVDVFLMDEVWEAAKEIGFYLPELESFSVRVPESLALNRTPKLSVLRSIQALRSIFF